MKRLLHRLSRSLLIILFCLQTTAFAQEWAAAKVYATNSIADETSSRKSLKRILKDLETKFDVRFGYLDEAIENKSVSQAALSEPTVEEALDNVLTPLGLVYRKLGDRFYLIQDGQSDKIKASLESEVNPLMTAHTKDMPSGAKYPISQQSGSSFEVADFSVSGRVTDAGDGSPVPGVNVLVKGTTSGTTSDSDGRYTVNAPDGDAILIFSFIGYQSQEVPVNSQSIIDISLTQDAQELSEVVVVGYGTVQKKDLTGSVSVIDNEQLVKRGTVNPLEAMQGQVAGVDISNSSGRAGAGFNIQIRGQQSIEGGNPLYVVDGVITDGIEFLNPQDIERIDILKDASSTAIYGSRGAYGVVLVTTKQGANVQERAIISYDGYYGVRTVARLPEFMDGDTWMNWREDAYISEAITRGNPVPSDPGWNTQSDEMRRRVDQNDFTDWPDLLTQNGRQANHWISLSGMSDNKMGYTFGVGYQEEEGNVIREKYKRYNFKASINHAISEKWSGGINMNLALINYEEGAPNAMVNAFRMNPIMSPYNTEDGEIIIQPGKDLIDGTSNQYHINFTSSVNPLVDMANANQETNTLNAIGNVFLQFAPIEWLSLKSTFSPRYRFRRAGVFLGTDSEGRVGGQPRGEMEDTEDFSYIWDNQVSLNKQINDHSFNFMGLFSMNMFRNEFSFMAQDRMDMSAKSFYNVGSGGDLSTIQVAGGYEKETILSYALRLNYSFLDKYLVTISNRWDGASVLAEGNKWANFPSAAIGWRVSQEPFMQDIRFLNDLKFRLSYGFTGNKVVNPYATLATASTGMYYDFGGIGANGIRTDGIANTSLTWERTSELDFGVDFSLLQSRVLGTFDVYSKESKDLIIERQLPFETGYSTVFQNIGEVTNKGIEVTLTTINVSTDNITWSTTFNFSKNNNKVTALYEDTNEIYKDAEDGYSADDLIRVGYPLNSYYNWVADGVWHADETDLASAYGQSEGEGRVVDFNGNGIIQEDDKRMIGSKLPDWTGGFTTTLTFRNFDLSASLITRQGVFVYSPFHAEYTNHEDRGRSKLDIDWYMQENPETQTRIVDYYPQPKNAGIYWRNSRVGYYRDATFTKIKNITLGYTFPAARINQIGLQNLRVYANVINPFVFTDYDGFDPEWADASVNDGGISSTTYQFGVNLKF